MTKFIKLKIQWCNRVYKTFQNSFKNPAQYNVLQWAVTEVFNIIYEEKIITAIF